jgi:hypothetical protein
MRKRSPSIFLGTVSLSNRGRIEGQPGNLQASLLQSGVDVHVHPTQKPALGCIIRTLFVVASIVFGVMTTAVAQVKNFTPITQEMLLNPSPDDWLMLSRTYDQQRLRMRKIYIVPAKTLFHRKKATYITHCCHILPDAGYL